MPANLTPQYSKAEDEYRRAQTTEERIVALEKMFQVMPKHKGTEKLQADLKTKLKETREELSAEKKAPKKGKSYKIPRQGAGQVVLLGAPNAGKSKIVATLTHAKPEVAAYPFTTREPMPAMMPWNDVSVQLVDLPPIAPGNVEPYIVSMARTAYAALLVMNGSSDDAPDETAIVLDELKNRKTHLAETSGFVDDDFSSINVRTLFVVTCADAPGVADRLEYFRELTGFPLQPLLIELDRADSAESLRDAIYRKLDMIRVYTKAPGKPADWSSPFSLPAGATIEDLAGKVHRDLADSLKFAKIWGTAVHDGQSVGPDHILHDRDMVELHS